MLIFCDVDDVVADLMPIWLNHYNHEYADCLTRDDILGWDVHDYVKPGCAEKVYQYLHIADLYDAVKPVDGALEGIQTLRADGHRIVFATASNIHQAGKKLQWLNRHGFLGLDRGTRSPDYIEIQDKSLLYGDLIIDDAIHNLYGFFGMRLLYDRPHNANNEEYKRATNWQEVVSIVRSLGEDKS